jgi:hypothetical protein
MVPAIHAPARFQSRHIAPGPCCSLPRLWWLSARHSLPYPLATVLAAPGARCHSSPRRCLFAALLCSLGRVLSWSLSTTGPAALPPASPASPPRPPTAVPLANPGHPACRTAAREWVPAALPQRWRLRAQAQPDENAGVLRARALNLSLTHTDTHTHTTHNTLSASSFASL